VLGGLLLGRSRRRGRDEYGSIEFRLVGQLSTSSSCLVLAGFPPLWKIQDAESLPSVPVSVLMSFVLAPIYDRVDDEEEGGISPFFWRMRWRRRRKIRIFRSTVTRRRVRGECHRSELKQSG
jgi:hypothetical protein